MDETIELGKLMRLKFLKITLHLRHFVAYYLHICKRNGKILFSDFLLWFISKFYFGEFYIFEKKKALLLRLVWQAKRLRKCNSDIRKKLVLVTWVAVTWCKVWSVMRGSLRAVMTIGRPDGGRDKNSPSLLGHSHHIIPSPSVHLS